MPISTKQKFFSAHVDGSQGFQNPEPLADIPGWTVWKKGQTEIYEITHNLGLVNPDRQMHIVATPMKPNIKLCVESVEKDHFTISTWGNTSQSSSFMFIAIQYSKG
jgi:hypothetical protein